MSHFAWPMLGGSKRVLYRITKPPFLEGFVKLSKKGSPQTIGISARRSQRPNCGSSCKQEKSRSVGGPSLKDSGHGPRQSRGLTRLLWRFALLLVYPASCILFSPTANPRGLAETHNAARTKGPRRLTGDSQPHGHAASRTGRNRLDR